MVQNFITKETALIMIMSVFQATVICCQAWSKRLVATLFLMVLVVMALIWTRDWEGDSPSSCPFSLLLAELENIEESVLLAILLR